MVSFLTMGEKYQPEKFRNSAQEIWKKSRESFRRELAEFYKSEGKNFPRIKKRGKKGIVVDFGNPHKSALFLTADGNLHLIRYQWAPEPEENSELPDIEFCLKATEVLRNSSRT